MAKRNRKQNVKKRRIALGRLTVVITGLLIVLALIIGGVYLLTHPKTSALAGEQMPFAASQQYQYTDAGFLYMETGVLHYDDITDDSMDYTATVSAEQASLVGRGAKTHVLYNDIAMKIIGAAEPCTFTGTAVRLAAGNGYVAALQRDGMGEESLLLFDGTGTQTDTQIFAGQLVEDFGFYTVGGSEFLYVETLDNSGGVPITTIRIYDMTKGSTTGVMQIQNQMIGDLRFTDSAIYLVGTSQIIRYAHAGNKESWRETVYGFELLDFAPGKTPVFLLTPRSSESLGMVKILQCADADVAAAKAYMLQVPAGALGAFLMNGKLAVVTPTSVCYYDYNGKKGTEYPLDVRAESVQKLTDTMLLIKSGEKMLLYRLK